MYIVITYLLTLTVVTFNYNLLQIEWNIYFEEVFCGLAQQIADNTAWSRVLLKIPYTRHHNPLSL